MNPYESEAKVFNLLQPFSAEEIHEIEPPNYRARKKMMII